MNLVNAVGKKLLLERNQAGIYGIELALREFSPQGAILTMTREPGGEFHFHVHARTSPVQHIDATGRTLYKALENLLNEIAP